MKMPPSTTRKTTTVIGSSLFLEKGIDITAEQAVVGEIRPRLLLQLVSDHQGRGLVECRLGTAIHIAWSASGVGMISNSRMYRGGLKKCVPNQAQRKSSENPSAILPTGRPLVLVVTIVPGLRTASTFFSKARLMSRFSTTASMIQSTSASFLMSSSKLPTVTNRASDVSMNAAGLDFFAASSPAAANLFRAGPSASGGTISNR